MKHYITLLLLLFVAGITGCKKQVDVGSPETNPTSASIYTSDASAASVITYLYAKMSGGGSSSGALTSGFAQGNVSINVYTGLAADELRPYSANAGMFGNVYKNNSSVAFPNMWKELYGFIYVANAVIEGIANSTGGMTDSVKKQLTGEAKFMRAFLHFYAVNLFGDVPFISTTDYEVNAIASRMSKQEVYGRIVADLQDAKNLLPDNYVLPTGTATTLRVRPNKWTATAFLARVYLYMNEWAKAESEAGTVLANTAKFGLVTDLTKAFMKDSREVIWNLQPVITGFATLEGNVFLLTAPPNNSFPVSLRPTFLDNFEAGDKRRTSWIDSPVIASVKYYCPSKYKTKQIPTNVNPIPSATEYLAVFRLAEQYLIRAEARARQNKIIDAQNDLSEVRKRAGLLPTTANDQPTLLSAIEHERQTELFCEWGHRWFDLKRTGRVDAVMPVVTPLKGGGAWNTNMQLFPIPSNEISLNPNLAPQNPGYN